MRPAAGCSFDAVAFAQQRQLVQRAQVGLVNDQNGNRGCSYYPPSYRAHGQAGAQTEWRIKRVGGVRGSLLRRRTMVKAFAPPPTLPRAVGRCRRWLLQAGTVALAQLAADVQAQATLCGCATGKKGLEQMALYRGIERCAIAPTPAAPPARIAPWVLICKESSCVPMKRRALSTVDQHAAQVLSSKATRTASACSNS